MNKHLHLYLGSSRAGVEQYEYSFSLDGRQGTQKFSIPQEEKRRIKEEAVELVNRFPHEVMVNGKPIISQMSDGFFNAWYYVKFRATLGLTKRLELKHIIDALVKDGTSLTVHSDFSLPSSWFKRANVSLVMYNAARGRKTGLRKYLSYVLKRTLKGSKAGRMRDRLMVVDRPIDYRQSISIKGEKDSINQYLGQFIESTSLKPVRLAEQSVPKPSDVDWNQKDDSYADIYGDALFPGRAILRVQVSRRYALSNYQLVLADININELDEKQQLLLGLLPSFKSSVLMYHLKYLVYRSVFKHKGPKAIITIDEQGPWIRCIIDAAAECRIPRFAVQHGAIHSMNPSHRYDKRDLTYRPALTSFLCWGTDSKVKLANQFVFAEEQIDVVGQQRTDVIQSMSQTSNDATICLATQPLPDAKLMSTYVHDLLSLLTKKEYRGELVIRVHPGERDISYVTDAIRLYPELVVRIDRESNLYELLSETAILLTAYSTVGIEAQYFDVPVVILDYQEEDLLGLCAAGVALQAVSKKSLESAITKMLSGERVIMASKRESFIAHSVHAIDGKVVERMDEVIKKRLSDS